MEKGRPSRFFFPTDGAHEKTGPAAVSVAIGPVMEKRNRSLRRNNLSRYSLESMSLR